MTAFEWTDGWSAAMGTAVRIVVVLVIGLALNLVARRAIGRLTTGIRRATREFDEKLPAGLLTSGSMVRAEARANTLNSVLRSTTSGVILATVVLVILGQFEVNLAPLIAGAGVVSIAIGFGAQSLVRDVVTGVFVLLEDQYGVGDIVDLGGGATGTVERVTLRVTRLRDVAGTVWYVPNGSVTVVANRSQYWARALVDVTVAPSTPVEAARAAIRDAVAEVVSSEELGGLIHGTPDEQGVQAFSPQGVTLRVIVDTEPAAQWRVERAIRERIKTVFDERGIQLATIATPFGGG
jgi:small conductance mechanosensitive channel